MDTSFEPLLTPSERVHLVEKLKQMETTTGIRIIVASVTPELFFRTGDLGDLSADVLFMHPISHYLDLRNRKPVENLPEAYEHRDGRFTLRFQEFRRCHGDQLDHYLGDVQYGDRLVRNRRLEALYEALSPAALPLRSTLSNLADWLRPIVLPASTAQQQEVVERNPEILARNNLDMSLCRAAFEVLGSKRPHRLPDIDGLADRTVEHWSRNEERLRSTEDQWPGYVETLGFSTIVPDRSRLQEIRSERQVMELETQGLADVEPALCVTEVYFSDTHEYAPSRSLRTALLSRLELLLQEREDDGFRL